MRDAPACTLTDDYNRAYTGNLASIDSSSNLKVNTTAPHNTLILRVHGYTITGVTSYKRI